jgi:hypothetical protein
MLSFLAAIRDDSTVCDVGPVGHCDDLANDSVGRSDDRHAAPDATVGLRGETAASTTAVCGTVGRKRRRGHQAGVSWTKEQRLKFSATTANKRLHEQRALNDKVQKLLGIGSGKGQSVQRDVSADIMLNPARRGTNSLVASHVQVSMTADGTDLQSGSILKKSVERKRRLKLRGAASHVLAMRPALTKFIDGCEALVVSAVLDDASIWVRKRTEDGREVKRYLCNRKATAAKRQSGRNVHMPTLACVQRIIKIDGVGRRAGVKIHTPCQVLPRANWSTIHNRFSRWSFSGLRPGRKLAPLMNLQLLRTMARVPDVALLITQDNLVTNRCIIAEEQNRLADLRREFRNSQATTDYFRGVFDTSCVQHSGCLCTKPVYRRLGLPSVLVKLGHTLESGTTFTSFRVRGDALLRKNFQYRPCAELPPESAHWRAHAVSILRASVCNMDLKSERIDEIVKFFNDDWTSQFWTHYCVVGECTFGCDRDPAKAAEVGTELNDEMVGGGPGVPLEYRFKGVEMSNGWTLRNEGNHGFLHRTLEELFPASKRRDALREVEQMRVRASVDEQPTFAVQAAVRADAVITHLRHEGCLSDHMKGHVAAKPLQKWMNRASSADKAACAVAADVSYAGMLPAPLQDREPEQDDPCELPTDMDFDMSPAELQAFKRNCRFANADYGYDVVIEYTELLTNFNSWDVPLPFEERAKLAPHLACSLGNAWRRLVFRFLEKRWQLFNICHDDQMLPVFNERRIDEAVATFRNLGNVCAGCLDIDWTVPVLDLCRVSKRRCHRLLVQVLTHLHVAGAIVERAHVPAEESKPGKARGSGLSAEALSTNTYLDSAAQESAAATSAATSRILKDSGMAPQSYFKLREGLTLGLGTAAKVVKKTEQLRQRGTDEGTGSTSRTRGYDAFQRQFMTGKRPGSDAWKEAKALCDTAWAALGPAEKDTWSGRAVGIDLGKSEVFNKTTVDDINRSCVNLSARVRNKAIQRLALDNASKINNHSLWNVGLGLWGAHTSLKPELVNAEVTDDHIKDMVTNELFEYDEQVNDNPPGTRIPRTGCHVKLCGLCQGVDGDVMPSVLNGVFNIYIHLKQWKLQATSPEWPLLTSFSIEHRGVTLTSPHMLMVDSIGKGEAQVLLVMVPLATDDKKVHLDTAECHRGVIPQTLHSHVAIRDIVQRAADAWALPIRDITNIRFSVLQKTLVHGVNELQYEFGGPMKEADLKLDGRMKEARDETEALLPWQRYALEDVDEGDGVGGCGEPLEPDIISGTGSDIDVDDDVSLWCSDCAEEPPPSPEPPARVNGIVGYSFVALKKQTAACVACDGLIHIGNYRWICKTKKTEALQQVCPRDGCVCQVLCERIC